MHGAAGEGVNVEFFHDRVASFKGFGLVHAEERVVERFDERVGQAHLLRRFSVFVHHSTQSEASCIRAVECAQ